MVDALLVFIPLQGSFFFALRAPCKVLYKCSTSATSPALTVCRSLASSSACALVSARFCWLVPEYAASPRSSFARLMPLAFAGSLHPPLTSSPRSPLGARFPLASVARCVASYLPFELDLRSGLPLRLISISSSFLALIATKQFRPSLTFVLSF